MGTGLEENKMKLTTDQRACEAVRYWDIYGEEAYLRKISTQNNNRGRGTLVISDSGLGETRKKLSKEFGVGKNKVQAARTLYLQDRERFERVAAGLEPLPKSEKDIQAIKGGPWVYLIGHKNRSDLPVKIGKANNVFSRMSSLQTSHYTELEILFVIPGYSKLEKELHSRYRQHHVRGEWFSLTPLQIDQIKLEYQGKVV